MTNNTKLIQENIKLAPYTYYKIGGPAKFFAVPNNAKDLFEISDFIKKVNLKYFILGSGSNILFDDKGFDGIVIQTNKLNQTCNISHDILTLGCSVKVIQALRFCMQNGIDGLEILAGVPGDMGGVICMNAGTKLGEIKDVCVMVHTFNLMNHSQHTYLGEQLKFSYRKNNFLKPHDIVLSCDLRLKPNTDTKIVQDKITKLLEERKKSQPIDKPSCGSVFKNPDPSKKVFAWKCIADAGLRGFKSGNAQISELHTNFIVNMGGATSQDVKNCIYEAKKQVKDKLGIDLEEEVQIISY